MGGKWEGPPLVEVGIGLGEWYEAFSELSTDRQIGMGLGPLPSASIDRYISDHDLGYDDADMFRACMRAMDELFREGDKSAPPRGTVVRRKSPDVVRGGGL